MKIFGSGSTAKSSNLPESKNFLENLFQTFLIVFNLKAKDTVVDSISPLETLYQKSQNAANIDNLGEPWEHFKKALATGHYQLMPIYNENSKGLLEPAAFAVFEKLDMGETKTSLFKQLAHSSFSAADIKNTKVNFLDKVITNGFDPNLDMNALQRFSVDAFMNMQSRDSVLMVPWRADAVEKLSSTVVKGVNHIGFTRINGDIQITPRHEIEGREYPTLKATTIFTKYPKDFETRELKALTLLQVLSELSAGPVMRFSGAAAKQQIKALADDTFKNIDAERVSESGLSFNPFKMLAGFFNK
jgi:glutathione peroxidase-family protein